MKFIDLPLTQEELHVLSFHLELITRRDVADVLKEMNLTNDVDLALVKALSDRLFEIGSGAMVSSVVGDDSSNETE